MTRNYGNWNNAAYYPNCNRTSGMLAGYSTEKMLYGDQMEIQIRNCYNNGDRRIGSFEMNILVRVAASCGLTRGQLESYLLMQGMNFSEETMDDRLYNMVKFGYLSWVKLRRTKDDMEIMLYDLAERGIALLREHELPSRNPAGEYFLSNDVFRYMRAKIVSNQLVLHFLGSLKGLRTFYFNRGLRLKGGNAPDQTYLAPLYVQTDAGNYIFDMVGNTTGGKKKFQERMERMLALQEYFPDRTYLAIVAETYEHMEFMTSLMLAYEKRGFGIDILYTHDSEWFYDTPGGFYAMARAMGQSGLMRVKIL